MEKLSMFSKRLGYVVDLLNLSVSIDPLLWSRLKNLNIFWVDCHEILLS